MKEVCPATYSGVFSVGALETNLIKYNSNDKISETIYQQAQNSGADNLSYTQFSNYGEMLDFSAPGKDILCMIPRASQSGEGKLLARNFMCFTLYSCNSCNYKKL